MTKPAPKRVVYFPLRTKIELDKVKNPEKYILKEITHDSKLKNQNVNADFFD